MLFQSIHVCDRGSNKQIENLSEISNTILHSLMGWGLKREKNGVSFKIYGLRLLSQTFPNEMPKKMEDDLRSNSSCHSVTIRLHNTA